MIDIHRDLRRRRAAVAVGNAVGELIDARVARRRRVGDGVIGVDRRGAVAGAVAAGDVHRQRIAVRVAVVGQHIDGHGGVLVGHRAAGLGVRSMVDRRDGDVDRVLTPSRRRYRSPGR